MGRPALTLVALALAAATASAQQYRARLDAGAQGVAFRGALLDSIPVTDTVSGPPSSGEGPRTPDGFAVRCLPGESYCYYYRPGPERRVAPMVLTAEGALWGFGVPGLSLRGTARVATDLGSDPVWPGTEPALQLLEGYAEYASEQFTAQAGRQAVVTRFGHRGFDGARLAYRGSGKAQGLTADGYLGLGLARATALPVTSPALDPLDDFQPVRREIVAGAGLGWSTDWGDARLVYERAVDRRSRYFVSERLGLDLRLTPVAEVTVTAGADADLAAGWLGSAELDVTFAPANRRVVATGGIRRYRPHFDLWTIWGAFSPVPFRALHGSFAVAPRPDLRFELRGERYEFEPVDVATPLVDVEDRGWRFAWSGTYTPTAEWTVQAGYQAEFGPGAASRGVDGRVEWAPDRRLAVTIYGTHLRRPLEFRYDNAKVRLVGITGAYRPTGRLSLELDGAWVSEERARPDAAAFDWNQLRLSGRCVVSLGRGADGGGLPPAVQQMPEGGAR